MSKKGFMSAATLVLLVLAVGISGYSQTTSPRCNNALIRGDYGFTIEGTKIGGPGPLGPMMGVAMTHFDGSDLDGVGKLSQIDSVVIGGVQVGKLTDDPASGSYQVNPDCTGTFTIIFPTGSNRAPVTTNFVVVQNGDEIDTVVVPPPGAPATAVVTRSIGKRRFTNHGAKSEKEN